MAELENGYEDKELSGESGEASTGEIRRLNDEFREKLPAGQVLLTAGVDALGGEAVREILERVRHYDAFKPGDDPHGEHDFGSLTRNGVKLFWKIDYYDKEKQYGSPNPAAAAITTRILTIMLAEEY